MAERIFSTIIGSFFQFDQSLFKIRLRKLTFVIVSQG